LRIHPQVFAYAHTAQQIRLPSTIGGLHRPRNDDLLGFFFSGNISGLPKPLGILMPKTFLSIFLFILGLINSIREISPSRLASSVVATATILAGRPNFLSIQKSMVA
jgi:hypothetical protein